MCSRIRCGKEHVEWDFAVVWVTPRSAPFSTPNKLLFYSSPDLPNDVPLQKSVRLIEQWTYRRGTCSEPFSEFSHEFRRARQLARQIIATYRRNYLKQHGSPPHSAVLTGGAQYGRPKLK